MNINRISMGPADRVADSHVYSDLLYNKALNGAQLADLATPAHLAWARSLILA